MNQAQIRKKFRDFDSTTASVSTTSDDLANWLAENLTKLQPTDVDFLVAVGRTLYTSETEQRWRDAW
jgi:ABC-type transporter Mla subunit MlaD